MAYEVWYLLEDGTAVDPNETSYDEKGVLMHKSGKKIAMRGSAYSSKGVDPEAERKKSMAPKEEPKKDEAPKAPARTRDLTPTPSGRGYQTR